MRGPIRESRSGITSFTAAAEILPAAQFFLYALQARADERYPRGHYQRAKAVAGQPVPRHHGVNHNMRRNQVRKEHAESARRFSMDGITRAHAIHAATNVDPRMTKRFPGDRNAPLSIRDPAILAASLPKALQGRQPD